jgi:hypothetical protein
MIGSRSNEIHEVLSRVTSWPVSDRIVLARQILETVGAEPSTVKRGYSAEAVIALLQMPQPAPDDSACQQILEEERLRKYGS